MLSTEGKETAYLSLILNTETRRILYEAIIAASNNSCNGRFALLQFGTRVGHVHAYKHGIFKPRYRGRIQSVIDTTELCVDFQYDAR